MHPSLLLALCVAPLSLAAARGAGRPDRECKITPPDYPEPEGNTYPRLLALVMECAKDESEAWDRSLSYLTEMTARGQRENPEVMFRHQSLFITPQSRTIDAAIRTPSNEDNPSLRWLMDEHGQTLAVVGVLLAGPCLQPRGVDDDERGRQMMALRNVGRLMMLRARALQEGGDLDGALGVLCDLLRLGEVLTRNAPLIPALAGIAVFHMAAHPLPACIHDGRTSDDALAKLERCLSETWERRVPAAEVLAIDWDVRREVDSRVGAKTPMLRFPPVRRPAVWLIGRFWAREQRAMCHVIELSRQPRWERQPIERILRRTIQPEADLRASDSFDTRDALIIRLRLQVAIERSRRRHGEAPASLTDLVPEFLEELPPDPFTGKAFHYEPGDGGYRLYSRAETEGVLAWRGTEPEEYKW